MARQTTQEVVNVLAATTNKTIQEALNILAGFTGNAHTEQECWNKLASGSVSNSKTSQVAANSYAATSGRSLQEATHIKNSQAY